MTSVKISLQSRRNFMHVLQGIAFLILVSINLAPFLWGVSTSLKTTRDINVYPPQIFNFSPTFEHYQSVLGSNFLQAMFNSIWYSLLAIVVCIVCAHIFAYAFSRFNFRGKKILFYIILSGIPLSLGSAALVVPNFLLFAKLNMVNQWYTLPLLYVAYNLPMSCWILIGGLESVPVSVEEAAMIDGANRRYIIFQLIPFMTLPTIACAALLTFIGAWNEYIVSSVLVNSTALYPIQVNIFSYLGYFGREWGPLMASSILAVIPILIVFSFLGKLLISGLTAGAVKE